MFDSLKLNRRDVGDKHEKFACEVLNEHGLQIIAQNYLCKMGEIDIIARDKDQLVFVEVRYRKSELYGGSLESVNPKKQKRIILAANHYLQKHNLTNKIACRFDVFAITGNLNKQRHDWIKGAFQASF